MDLGRSFSDSFSDFVITLGSSGVFVFSLVYHVLTTLTICTSSPGLVAFSNNVNGSCMLPGTIATRSDEEFNEAV
jgi:hypothetical protein